MTNSFDTIAKVELWIKKALHDVEDDRINLFLATKKAQNIQDGLLMQLDEMKADLIPGSSEYDVMERIRETEQSLKAHNQRSVRILKDLQDVLQHQLSALNRYRGLKFIMGLQEQIVEMTRQKYEGLLSPEQVEKLEDMQIIQESAIDVLRRCREEM